MRMSFKTIVISLSLLLLLGAVERGSASGYLGAADCPTRFVEGRGVVRDAVRPSAAPYREVVGAVIHGRPDSRTIRAARSGFNVTSCNKRT